MKILKHPYTEDFDLAIFGLGFESRASRAATSYLGKYNESIALGYCINTDKFSYQKNKLFFEENKTKIFEINDQEVMSVIGAEIQGKFSKPAHILLDITVMSRHRLAQTICTLIDMLPKKSTISVTYSISEFIEPPTLPTPIKHLCEISKDLCGSIGDPSKPSSVIFGLGYEPGKALGVLNFLEPNYAYVFIPNSPIDEFKKHVIKNNKDLLDSTPRENIFEYNVCSPYVTYLNLRSLTLSLFEFSRPLLIPLGPKIFSSLAVFLGKELFPDLPVWRVSSDFLETPVDRPPSGDEILYSITV